MSSFGFINDSKPNNNRTFIAGKYPKKNKYSKSLQQSVQALKKLPSNDEESSENQTQFDSSDDGGRSTSSPNKEAFLRSNSTVKQNFKSPFSFLNQYDEKNQASHVAKHPPLKFTSSFIIEDYIDNDYHPSSTRADKSGKKEDISSYFSLLDSYPAAFLDKKPSISNKSNDKLLQSASNDSLSVLQSEGRSPMINSAFDFINHATLKQSNSSTSSSLMDEPEIFVTSTSIIKPDKETQFLQASTRWQKTTKKREEQIRQIKNYYENQIKYHKMVHEIKDKIENIEYKKQQALDSEDFEAAHKYAIRKEKMEKDYSQLSSRNFEEQGKKEWQQLISVLQQESQDAENMAECFQIVKEERQRRIAVFIADKDRLYKDTVEKMEQKRANIESEKSEIAFDLGMWNQNHADLDERMEEAVQDEAERKKTLESKLTAIQSNIEELRQKLKQLEEEQVTVSDELKDVEAGIKDKLAIFADEIDESNTEKKAIEARQEEIQHELVLLEDQDAKMEKDIESQRTTQQLNEQELRQLTTQMEQATERAHASKIEESILGDILHLLTEKRGQTVAQHEAMIRRSRESINRKNHEIRLIQDKIYQCEQAWIDLEEDTTKITNKIKSLDKLKNIAVENGQFEKAGAASMKIKMANSVLTKLKERRDPREGIKIATDELKAAKKELGVLEQDLALVKNNQKTDLGLLLEKLKHQLNEKLQDSSLKTHDTLTTVVGYELKSIDTQLSDIQNM